MKPDPHAKIIEGEVYGTPVPGGWPDRGPFQVLGHALGRVFRRRNSRAHAKVRRPPAVRRRRVRSRSPTDSGTSSSGPRGRAGSRAETADTAVDRDSLRYITCDLHVALTERHADVPIEGRQPQGRRRPDTSACSGYNGDAGVDGQVSGFAVWPARSGCGSPRSRLRGMTPAQ